MRKLNILIKSGGGTGPMKPDNLHFCKVLNPVDEYIFTPRDLASRGVFLCMLKTKGQLWKDFFLPRSL